MFQRKLALAVAATLALVPALIACNSDNQAPSTSADGMVANLNGGSFTGNPNPQQIFNPFLAATTLNTTYIFEPLYYINGYNCAPTPWLGSAYSWSDPQHLTITARPGVKWSDGQPFTAKDVAYTFNLLHQVPAFDMWGVWRTMTSVTADGDKVLFTFSTPSVPTFMQIATVPIVPEHIWATQGDLQKFTNPNPVGTGPFLYSAFNTQQLILKRNPDYWQADKVKVQQLTFSNNGGGGDADKLRLVQGAYD